MDGRQTYNNDDELLSNNRRFDHHAFEIFFKTYFVQLCTFCQFKFGFDLDQSKDIVQTAFIRLWESRQNIADELAVKSYLLKIIHHHILDILKHDKVKHKYQDYLNDRSAELSFVTETDHFNLKQLSADIESSVSNLPGQMRKIFEMSRYDGLKYKEIAQQLNISIKTVETQISRALAKLRQELGHYLTILIIAGLITVVFKKYLL